MTGNLEDWRWLEAAGSIVETIELGTWWKVGLRGTGGDVVVRTADAVTVVQATAEVRISSCSGGDARLPLLALRGATVEALVASHAGVLEIVTSSGTIRIDPEAEFEAWELDGASTHGEFFVVSGFAGGTPQVFETATPGRAIRCLDDP